MQTRSQGDDSAVISVNKQSVNGLESWSTDLNGLTTHTELERLGNGVTRQTVTNPDGTKVITNTANGKTTTVQQVNSDGTNGNLISYTYDEFDRVVQMLETVGETTVNTTTMNYNVSHPGSFGPKLCLMRSPSNRASRRKKASPPRSSSVKNCVSAR